MMRVATSYSCIRSNHGCPTTGSSGRRSSPPLMLSVWYRVGPDEPRCARGPRRTLTGRGRMLRLRVQTVGFVVGLGAVLFIAADTVQWLGAWVFLGEICAGGLAVGLRLAKHDPGLLAERLSLLIQRLQVT